MTKHTQKSATNLAESPETLSTSSLDGTAKPDGLIVDRIVPMLSSRREWYELRAYPGGMSLLLSKLRFCWLFVLSLHAVC